jgi:hypothetical protein
MAPGVGRMQDAFTYYIEVQGQVEEKNFNTRSPYRITGVQAIADKTFFTISADQSGLIGLVRHLHQQGYVILSMHRTGSTKRLGE